eukprot:9375145-Ditylum_brightwellii.AAC.1
MVTVWQKIFLLPPRSPTSYSKSAAVWKKENEVPLNQRQSQEHLQLRKRAGSVGCRGEERDGEDVTETAIIAVAGEDYPSEEEDMNQEVAEDVANDSQFYIPTVSDCGPIM